MTTENQNGMPMNPLTRLSFPGVPTKEQAWYMREMEDRMWSLLFADCRDAEGNIPDGVEFVKRQLEITSAVIQGRMGDVVRLISDQMEFLKSETWVADDASFYVEAFKWSYAMWVNNHGYEHDGTDMLLEIWDAFGGYCGGDEIETYGTVLVGVMIEAAKHIPTSEVADR
jgi:hypothetical protein